jgi:hypothetical protein
MLVYSVTEMASRGAYIEREHRFSKRTRYTIWGVSIAIFLAGLIAVIVVFTSNSGHTKQVFSPKPAVDVSKNPKTVELDRSARRVAGQFILTAVARKDLRKAYALVGPGIKQGQSLKEWLTGNIAVVPYPVSDIRLAPFKIDYSYPDHALLEVALLPTAKAQAQGVKPQIFFVDMKKMRGKWLVDGWVPRASPAVPNASTGS